MRSVFILFKEASRAEVARSFDAKFARNGRSWISGESVYIGFYDDAEVEFEPELLGSVRSLSERKAIVAVMADISGRIPGDEEVLSFCSQILGEFSGWAMDDYSDHLWSIDEIRSKSLHAGHPFFDYNGWHKGQKNRAQPDGTDNSGADLKRWAEERMTPEVAAQLVEDLRGIRTRVRLKHRSGSMYDWSWPLFSPSPAYLETSKSGPLALSTVEYIDVEKTEQKQRGPLVPPVTIDHTEEIEALLAKRGLSFESRETFVRITA
ncbi:MAG: hypothetical protein QM760_07485 [Nibricoccus sp.]